MTGRGNTASVDGKRACPSNHDAWALMYECIESMGLHWQPFTVRGNIGKPIAVRGNIRDRTCKYNIEFKQDLSILPVYVGDSINTTIFNGEGSGSNL